MVRVKAQGYNEKIRVLFFAGSENMQFCCGFLKLPVYNNHCLKVKKNV